MSEQPPYEDLISSIGQLLKTLLFETLHEIELPSSVVSLFQEAISQVEFGLANTPTRSRGES